jgi:dynein heavy chain 1
MVFMHSIECLMCCFQAPNERARLYFLLAWFHAVVQERLVYAPLGWSKRYEFNESDLRCACDTIDIWIDTVSMVRIAVRFVLTVYG